MGKKEIKDHFEVIAGDYDKWKAKNSYYHNALKDFFGPQVTEDDNVIEYGCGTGDIIAAVNGKYKVGLDIAEQMVKLARDKHPEVTFHQHDCELQYDQTGKFNVAILPDIIDHITDILKLYASVNKSLKMGGRMCISTINPLWHPILEVGEKLGQKMPEGEHNFVPNRHLINFLELRGFKLVERGAMMLVPKKIPLISSCLNYIAPKAPLLNRFCLIQTLVAEKIKEHEEAIATDMTCSVVIPCFNEEANIERITEVPTMGKWTEVILVDDGSTDKTAEKTEVAIVKDQRVKLVSYSPNHGKGYAVKQGFDCAKGDIIMICDADMTVDPSELPLFFNAIADGITDFANGTRMIYPKEDQAMRFLNLLGNHFFGVIVSWLMGQRVSDTLCGTKALKRTDYANIKMGGDKWGDFDLLFGAAENKLRIKEVPVHYASRKGGESKMKPFKHCMVLIKVCITGFFRLKVFKKR